MAFAYTLTNAAVTNTDPAGTDLISLGDDNIRNFKSAIIERVNSRFADVNSDPWILKSPAGGSGNVQSVIPTSDNLYTLGEAARRWSDVRAVLATIGTLVASAALTTTGATATFDGGSSGSRMVVLGSAGDASMRLMSPAASGHYNWLISKSWTIANSLQFVPSTAADGSTFSTASMSITQTGVVTATQFTATTLTGTLSTAAQPNITSVGTLTSSLNSTAAAVINGSGMGINGQYLFLLNTGGNFIAGIESSAGATIVGGSSAYSTVVGTNQPRSLHFFTNSTIRQTIDSAGNVVFTGTVTAANFVGPTTIDANNLTGTTLNAGVIHSSLQDLGALTSLTVTGTGSTPAIIQSSHATDVGLVLNGTTAGSNVYHIFRTLGAARAYTGIANTAGGLVTGSLVGDYVIRSENFNIRFSANAGTSINASITTAGFVGNLTGTILTAAQGNITSLGTLTGLTIDGILNQGTANNASDKWIRIWRGNNPTLINDQGHFWTSTSGPSGIEAASVGGRTVQLKNVGGQYVFLDDSGRLLVNNTSTTSVAAGGIGVAGNSRFDGNTVVTGEVATGDRFRFTANLGSAGVAGTIYKHSTQGIVIWAPAGSVNDIQLANSAGNSVFVVPTGTVNMTFFGTLSGITTLTATSIFGTLATAAQTNVTSLGTLSALTVSGALVANSGINFSNFVGTVKAIAGSVGLSIRNNADAADNLLIADNGDVTVRGKLTFNGSDFAGVGKFGLGNGLGAQLTLGKVSTVAPAVANAAQNGWLKLIGSDAVTYYVPCWT